LEPLNMPTWLSDPPTSLYATFGAIGVLSILAAMFLFSPPPKKREPKQKKSSPRVYLFILGGVALLFLLGLYICDRLYESDREQIVRKLNEMSAGVRDRNLDLTFRHVSDSFRYGSQGKAQFRARGDEALRSGQVTEIPIWDVNFESLDPEAGKAVVNVRFKVLGSALGDQNQFLGEATFAREADGQWRMTKFRVFSPTGKKDEFHVQGL
jgi:hypothetical protein